MITLCVLGTAEEILSTADDLAIGLGECRPSSVVATAQITVMGANTQPKPQIPQMPKPLGLYRVMQSHLGER